MLKLPIRIESANGPWWVLCNDYRVDVKLYTSYTEVKAEPFDGCEEEIYPSVSHALHASRFISKERRVGFFELMPSQVPFYAKNLENRGLAAFSWKEVLANNLKGLLKQKFSYSILRRKLLSTFEAEIVLDDPGIPELGKVLMEVRDGK